MGIIYSSILNILGIFFIPPNYICNFRPIVNYNEVRNLQEVQMNIPSNMWIEWSSRIVQG